MNSRPLAACKMLIYVKISCLPKMIKFREAALFVIYLGMVVVPSMNIEKLLCKGESHRFSD